MRVRKSTEKYDLAHMLLRGRKKTKEACKENPQILILLPRFGTYPVQVRVLYPYYLRPVICIITTYKHSVVSIRI